jgi:hypothetical protein
VREEDHFMVREGDHFMVRIGTVESYFNTAVRREAEIINKKCGLSFLYAPFRGSAPKVDR